MLFFLFLELESRCTLVASSSLAFFFPFYATFHFVSNVNIAASSILERGLTELPHISTNFERSPQLLRGASEREKKTIRQAYRRGDACWRLGHQLRALRLMLVRVALTVSLRSVS